MAAEVKSAVVVSGVVGDARATPYWWKTGGLEKARLDKDYEDFFINVSVADRKLLRLCAKRWGRTINCLINEFIQYEIHGINYIVGIDHDIANNVKILYDNVFDEKSRLHIRVKRKIAEKYDVPKLVHKIIEKFRKEVTGGE